MEIDAIAVFVKVVEAGSFSGAARLLKMPKTTVSAKVAALEKRLGVTLIQRTTRKLNVTAAGQNYFRHCALAIQEIEKAESEISSEQGTPKGVLKVTAPADFGHSLLPRIVCEYLKAYPETSVELVVTNRIVDLVGEGVDLALRAGELKDSTMVAKKLMSIQMGFWASPNLIKKMEMPSHPRDLKNFPLLGHSNFRSKPLELIDGKSTFSLSTQPRIWVDDFETLKSLALLKEGIAYLPEFLVRRESKNKDLIPVLPQWSLKGSGSFSFVYPGQKYSSPKVRAFIDLALKICQDE